LLPKGRKNEEGGTGKPQIYYYIAPKLWAWKEYRIKSLKRDVDELFSILPFEVDFFEKKHHYPIHYVGNPTAQEVRDFTEKAAIGNYDFLKRNGLEAARPIIALLCGSRRQEIRDNLPSMITAASRHEGYQLVIAAAPNIDESLYREVMEPLGMRVKLVHHQSFELIHHARAALVTSGTATLETAILGTPQVACYRMNGSKRVYWFYRKLIKGKYVTLPNLIADAPIIPELLLHNCSVENVDGWLAKLLNDGSERQEMLNGYRRMAEMLTEKDCAMTTAKRIIEQLK
jgi:lipid-A-disaccharide synthase